MQKNEKYHLGVGEIDHERLRILNKLYNSAALRFLQECGLRSGMHLLEIGCGMGQFACELAKAVGSSGKVTAIDQSSDQITLAKKTAQNHSVSNIEFLHLAVENLDNIDTQFDMVYSRWTFIYLSDPNVVLETVKRRLKPGGILVIEDSEGINHAIFSYPLAPEITEWCNLFQAILQANKLPLKFSDTLYNRFQEVGFKNIRLAANQPLIITPEDKKVFHLAVLSAKQAIVEKNIMDEATVLDFIARLKLFEQKPNLIGFFRNILIGGQKST